MDKKKNSKYKVGIVTFHCAHNYGAILQTYALQSFLISIGKEPIIINYCPYYLIEPYRINLLELIYDTFLKDKKIRNLKSKIKSFVNFYPWYKQYKKFNKFIGCNLNLSSKIYNVNDIEKIDCDLFIIGSDQVWNLNITQNDQFYWGYFSSNKPKFAYSASLGMNKLDGYQSEYIKEALKNFSEITVREFDSVNLLSSLTDKIITMTLDPSFLLSKEEWEMFIPKVGTIKEKYILVYQIQNNDALINYAIEKAKEIDAIIIEITSSFRQADHIILNNANPFEFLYYIQNAECVITSSFHGTAFSLIFKKELYIFSLHNEGLNERLKSLIKIFSLIENFDSELPFMAYKLSYLDENSRRDQAINYSKQYIINCFNI